METSMNPENWSTGSFPTVQAVRCSYCDRLHVYTDETFIVIHGNVTIGMTGGLYGNSQGDKVSIFCFGRCLEYFYNTLRASEQTAKERKAKKLIEEVEKAKADKEKAEEVALGAMPDLDTDNLPPDSNPHGFRRNSFPPLIPSSSVFFDKRH